MKNVLLQIFLIISFFNLYFFINTSGSFANCSAAGTICSPNDSKTCTNAGNGCENYVCEVIYGRRGALPQCVEKGTQVYPGARDTAPAPTPTPPCQNGTCHTAIGDINTNPTDFVKAIFGVILGLAGGVALILIIISGYALMTSQGNPEKVQGAREQLTAAIVGLLFIIFSLVILQFIGVNILHIPGFG